MDELIDGQTIVTDSDDVSVRAMNGASLVEGGKVNSALRLIGRNEQVVILDEMQSCISEIEQCHCGLLVVFYLRVINFTDNINLIASKHIQVSDLIRTIRAGRTDTG